MELHETVKMETKMHTVEPWLLNVSLFIINQFFGKKTRNYFGCCTIIYF